MSCKHIIIDDFICRCIARQVSSTGLYGQDILSQTEVDHWLSFCLGPLSCLSELKNAINYLDNVLKPATFLVGKAVTIADYCVFGALNRSPQWLFMVEKNQAPSSLLRWYKMMSSRPEIQSVTKSLPAEAKITPAPLGDPNKEKKEESAGGKFVDLPGAEEGKVIVRFPPEASGFLHVGHAKAALLNNHYKESFKGKLIMRFDDTNPAKEKEEYEEVILEDLKMLQVKYDHFSRTSDHFEIILMYCEKLLKEGKAYVDDTDAETMKAEREAKKDSKNRNNSVAVNMKMWEEMKKGSDVGVKCAVRAKIDMQSANGCLRDPTIYRCKPEPHPATGTRYKVYPTYDFACPIVDSVEGVTHSLRTTEYMDRDDQFYWFINALGLRKPYIWAYARLNLTNTVMSKRKLTWLVDEGIVDGWDDPRLPTVRGVLRRGLTVEALKQFIVAQGSSRSVVFMEWDKIWAFNKKVLDPVVPRHTTVDRSYRVPVNVAGAKLNSISAARHPKNPDIGEKTVWTGPVLTIDGVDAEQLKEGENATFINWGNLVIKKVNKSNGKVVSVDAEDNTSNKDFKKTLKLTWLCENEEKSPFTPSLLIYYDHIISKAILDKDDDFKNFVGQDSKHEVEMLGDPELKNLKKGDMVQIQRRGYFICDVPYAPYDQSVGKPRPVVLIAIPDGTPNSYGPPGKSAAPAAPSKAKEAGGKSAGKAKPQKAAAPAKVEGAGAVDKVLNDIKAQGDKVRTMKEAKADKASVGEAVKVLLDLKAQYKQLTGKDWTPTATAPAAAPAAAAAPSAAAAGGVEKVLNDIKAQGDKVRTMKEAKADKASVGEAVKVLLDLKAQYKQLTGKDWTPTATAPAAAPAAAAAPSAAAAGGVEKVLNDIKAQGDKVRTMKEAKADKAAVGEAVKVLLDLKAQYKQLTGKDWTPNATAPAAAPAVTAAPSAAVGGVDKVLSDIKAQGDKVRTMKEAKADKAAVGEAVKVLLDLKAQYKQLTGKDWTPNATASAAPAAAPKAAAANSASSGGAFADINNKIVAQGDIVRRLKTEKADKADIDANVKILLQLKADFKASTGQDWKPGMNPPEPKAESGSSDDLDSKIRSQGDKVRKLKGEKADKKEIDEAVKVLLALKADFKAANGIDWKPDMPAAAKTVPVKQGSGGGH